MPNKRSETTKRPLNELYVMFKAQRRRNENQLGIHSATLLMCVCLGQPSPFRAGEAAIIMVES